MTRWLEVDGEQRQVALGMVDTMDPASHAGPDCGCDLWGDPDSIMDPACWAQATEAGLVAWGVWRDDVNEGAALVSWLPRLSWRVADDPVIPGQLPLFDAASEVTW